jgi:hypothetical protein
LERRNRGGRWIKMGRTGKRALRRGEEREGREERE